MKISIITVCFNAEKTIASTISSVNRQANVDVEHIFIDGQSTDNTCAIIKKFKRYSGPLVCEKDNGVYDAMNKGLKLASGEVIGFLNADDEYFDDNILTEVDNCFSDALVDACYADLIYVDRDNTSKLVRYWRSRDYSDGLFEKGWMPAHPTFFVRRSVYEKLGRFDLDFRRQADFELSMRFLAVNKIKSVYIPRIFVKMRMGGLSNNNLMGIIKGNFEAYKACKKNKLKVNALFIFRKILSRLPQYFSRPVKSEWERIN